jgi:hypothetical protein
MAMPKGTITTTIIAVMPRPKCIIIVVIVIRKREYRFITQWSPLEI